VWELQDQLDEAPTKETKESKIREPVVTFFGFEPRPKQLELVCVVVEKKDLILMSKDLLRKKSYPQAVPLLLRRQLVICALPRSKSIKWPGFLEQSTSTSGQTTSTNKASCFAYVKGHMRTHVYVSPELLVGPKFQGVLRNVTFAVTSPLL
jgi:hypothetical protein